MNEWLVAALNDTRFGLEYVNDACRIILLQMIGVKN